MACLIFHKQPVHDKQVADLLIIGSYILIVYDSPGTFSSMHAHGIIAVAVAVVVTTGFH